MLVLMERGKNPAIVCNERLTSRNNAGMNKTPPPLPPQRPTNLHQESRLTAQAVGGVQGPYREQQLNPALIVLALLMFLLLFLLLTTFAYKLVTSDGGSEGTAQAEGAGDSLGAGSVGTSYENGGENESGVGDVQPEAGSAPVARESDDGEGAEDASESSDPELVPGKGGSSAPPDDSSRDSESESESKESTEDEEGDSVAPDEAIDPQDEVEEEAEQEEKEAEDVSGVAVPRMLNSGPGLGGAGGKAGVVLSEAFQDHLAGLRVDGLEVALLFDATSSMHAQIASVKRQLRKIVGTVHTLVPMAEFTVAVYRDFDSVPAEGIKLTTDAKKIDQFVNEVRLIGGGDLPESVGSGLEWVTKKNSFSDDSSRVLIIVGDAPPHNSEMDNCLSMIRKHVRNGKSRVYTLTCNRSFVIPEFETLAKAGNGTALSIGSGAIVKELLVLSLGAEYRDEIEKMIAD